MPRWGLPVGPADAGPHERSGARETDRARALLTATMVLLALAALSELARYILLLWGRTHLVHRVTAGISDATVLVFGYASMVFAALSAIACAVWLVRARAEAFRAAHESEPRRARWMYAGVLVPVVNLVYPGVLLTELVRARGRGGARNGPARAGAAFDPGLGPAARPRRVGGLRGVFAASGASVARFLRRVRGGYRRLRDGAGALTLVRFWWGAWVLANAAAAGVALQRLDGSVQARADGVVFSVAADLLGLAAAVVTRIVLDRISGRAAPVPQPPAHWVVDADALRDAVDDCEPDAPAAAGAGR